MVDPESQIPDPKAVPAQKKKLPILVPNTQHTFCTGSEPAAVPPAVPTNVPLGHRLQPLRAPSDPSHRSLQSYITEVALHQIRDNEPTTSTG